jgi:hypothetical protein
MGYGSLTLRVNQPHNDGLRRHQQVQPRQCWAFNAFALRETKKHPHAPASNADGRNIQWLTEAEIALADSIPSLWDETKAQPADKLAALRRLIMIVDPQLSQREGRKTAPEAGNNSGTRFKLLYLACDKPLSSKFFQLQWGETMTTFLQRFDDIVRAPQIELENPSLCSSGSTVARCSTC